MNVLEETCELQQFEQPRPPTILPPKLIERCVVVARQHDGYGLTVTGGFPVKVGTVKPNGAAYFAGVKEADCILKVNGMPVTALNHQEILRMISGGYNVALTLLGPPRTSLTLFETATDFVSSPEDELFEKRAEDSAEKYNSLELNELHQRQELLRRLALERARQIYRFDGASKKVALPSGKSVDSGQRTVGSGRARKLGRLLSTVSSDDESSSASTQKTPLSNLSASGGSDTIEPNNSNGLLPIESSPKTISTTLSSGNNNTSKVEPVKSWVESGGLHYGTADSLPPEEESADEGDLSEVGGLGNGLAPELVPFSDLQQLKSRPAHLAIFISHLVHGGGNPSSLLFYLITDHYPTSGVKEIRRFAYEIFSTFLIPNAPLQVPNIGQSMIQTIDKVLRTASAANVSPSDIEQMKRLFIGARTRVIGEINAQLVEFRRRKRTEMLRGELDPFQLDTLARNDHSAELRLSEQILFKLLEEHFQLLGTPSSVQGNALPLSELIENSDPRILALIISICSVMKVVLSLKPANSASEKLLEKCPCFLTSSKGSSTVLSKVRAAPMLGGKKTVQVKDHNFVLNPVFLTIHCYHCQEVVWGVNPQAYFCQNCDVVVHKQCTARLTDNCYPATQQKTASLAAKSGGAGGPLGFGRFKPQLSASSTAASLNKQHQQQYPAAAELGGRLHIPGGTTFPALHPQQQQQQKLIPFQGSHRISDAHSAVTSVSGYASAGAATRDPHHRHHHKRHQHHQNKYHNKESMSLTPPMARCHRSSTSVGPEHRDSLASKIDGGSTIAKHHSSEFYGGRVGGLHGAVLRHAVAGTISSPPSSPHSSAFLPPRVFSASSRFESIDIPPDLPPPPPPPPEEEPDEKTTPTISALKSAPVAGHPMEPGKSISSDSGIGKEHAAGTARNLPTRTRSTKSDGTAPVRRVSRVVHSMGAKDSAEVAANAAHLYGAVTEESSTHSLITTAKTMSNLTVPMDAAAKTTSSSSSAQDIQHMGGLGGNGSGVADVGTAALIVQHSLSFDNAHQPTVSKEEARRMFEQAEGLQIRDGDSDLEVDNECPSLESQLSWEVIKHMKPKEKKRQEVISEFFHTERTHLRNLKILYKVFYRPMVLQRVIPPETIKLLFSNLPDLLELHSTVYQKMKLAKEKWKKSAESAATEGIFGDIGELVEEVFGGDIGDRLMKSISIFCAHQQHALDYLAIQRQNRLKEDPLSLFLSEAESNSLCRKFQLKDMIPVEMQRLVKYPLLLENIAKYTPDPSDELQKLLHGVQCAKKILSVVNSAKRNAENHRRLVDLQRRLEIPAEGSTFFQKFDFRQHKLVYEGHLQWRQTRGKTIDLHVVLLEHLLVFLTKSGDSANRLQLKIHEAGCIPIMKLASVEVEEKPTDKRALNVLYKSDLRIFELLATTATERKTWARLIENQAEVSQKAAKLAGTHRSSDIDLFSGGFIAAGSPPTTHALPAQQAKMRVVGSDDAGDDAGLVTARVEQVHVLTHPTLVGANEILVQEPKIVNNNSPSRLGPGGIANSSNGGGGTIGKGGGGLVERLQHQDQLIIAALAEKHAILCQMLVREQQSEGATAANPTDLEQIAEQMTGLAVGDLKQRNPKELAMSAIVHGNRLLDSISKGMAPSYTQNNREDGRPSLEDTERQLPSVPCYKLTAIAAPLINHLKALMQVVQEREAEILSLRQRVQQEDSGGQQPSGGGVQVNNNNNNTVVLKSLGPSM